MTSKLSDKAGGPPNISYLKMYEVLITKTQQPEGNRPNSDHCIVVDNLGIIGT